MGILYNNMKLWGLLVIAASALAQYDDLGNKADKGPRWCGGKGNQVKDSGNLEFVCRSRNGKSKHPNLTKRCKVKCNGKTRNGPKKFFCDPKVGWIKRKDPTQPSTPAPFLAAKFL